MMPIIKGPTAQVCEWACSMSYKDLPSDVRKEAVTLVYDTVGGLMAACRESTCQPVVDLVKDLGGKQECSIVGHPVKTSVLLAALVNGTIGHADEVDATGMRSTGHFASVMVPTALSVGQHVGASGRLFLLALAIGSEVGARMTSTLSDAVPHVQNHLTDRGSVMGAAVVAGLLLGLNA